MNHSGWTILIPCLSQNHTDTSILRSTAGLDLLSWYKQREVALSDVLTVQYNKIEGKQYRLRSPKLIANEIEMLVKETGISHVEFADSIFNIPLSHAKEVLREVIRKKPDLRNSKRFSFRFPNFYFYQKENITPGWILVFGNLLLKALVHGLCIWDMRLNKIKIYCFSYRANQKAKESDTR